MADFSLQTLWSPDNLETQGIDLLSLAIIKETLCFNGLLNKQLIKVVGEVNENQPAYQLTPLGKVVAEQVKAGRKKFEADPSSQKEIDDK